METSAPFQVFTPRLAESGIDFTCFYAEPQLSGKIFWCEVGVQWRLDLTDTDLAENLDLKDTLQKIWATIFLVRKFAQKSGKTRYSGQKVTAKSSFHRTR